MIQRVNGRALEVLGVAGGPFRQRELAEFFSGPGKQLLIPFPIFGGPSRAQTLAVSLQSGLAGHLTLRAILPDSLHLLLCFKQNPGVEETAAAPSRRLEAELRCVLDAVQAGVVIFDLGGRVRFSSRRLGELFGWDAAELINIKTFDDLAEAMADRLRPARTLCGTVESIPRREFGAGQRGAGNFAAGAPRSRARVASRARFQR